MTEPLLHRRDLSTTDTAPDAVCECGWIFDGPDPGECLACALGVDMRDDEDEDEA